MLRVVAAFPSRRPPLLSSPRLVLDAAPAVEKIENSVGVNVFLEQEVEPEKRQRSLELLTAAGVG